MRTFRRGVATLLLLALLSFTLVAAGCGSKSSTSSNAANSGNGAAVTTTQAGKTHLPTLKFVLHAGLAFGAFHRYIYKPFKAGSFTGGNLSHHKLAVVKAGLAGLFAYHELKLAIKDAKASPILRKLVTPFTALASSLSSLGSRLKGGHVDPAAIEGANSGLAAAGGLAGQNGASITDKIPGALQLARG